MAALTSLQNGTSSNQNLVTGVTIQGYAATAGRVIKPRVYIVQLNGAAATLTIGIRNTTDSSWVWRGTWIKGTAADTIAEPDFPTFIANGKTYAIFVSSSNASDTTTPDVTVDWFDMTHVDLDAVKGTSNNASGLGSAGGDYYNNTRFNSNVTGVDGVTATWSGVSGSVLFLRGTAWSTVAATDIVSSGAINTSSGAVSNVTTVGSVTTKTGYALASNGLASVTAWTVNITGDITGNLSGSVGSVFGTVDANLIEISGSSGQIGGLVLMCTGYLDNGKLNANVTSMAADTLTASALATDAANEIKSGLSTLSAADIRTAVGLASANLDTQLSAIVADTNELQLDWMNGGRLDLILDASAASASTAATNAINANTNTSTIITNLQVVDDNVDAIKLVTVKLDSMLVADGDNWQFTEAAGELFVVNVTLDAGDITLIVNGVVAGLAGTEVNYTGPVLEDGSIDLVEGDDYTSRPFTWTITGYTGPSLSGAAAVLRFIPMADYNLSGNTATAEVSKSFTLTQSGTTVTVSVAPTASDLTALTKTHPPLPSPNYKVQVKATSSNVTLVLANATRRRLIGPTA